MAPEVLLSSGAPVLGALGHVQVLAAQVRQEGQLVVGAAEAAAEPVLHLHRAVLPAGERRQGTGSSHSLPHRAVRRSPPVSPATPVQW